jgi:hypothetical protein
MNNYKKAISVSEAQFPVSLQDIGLATGMNVVNSERSQMVVGEFDGQKNILGVHSGRYSLITNEMLVNTIHKVLMKFPSTFEISIDHHRMMQFQIQVKFLDYIKTIGTDQDKVNCSFIIKNGYDGKQKFGLHGVAMREKSKIKQAYYLSTYRQICSNGLHGWVDESVSFEKYVDLLREGRKVKHKELTFDQEKVSQNDVRYTHKHSGIDVEQFAIELESSIEALAELYQKAVSGVSNTFQVYSEMSEFKIKTSPNEFIEKIQKRIGANYFPQNLVTNALGVLSNEQYRLNLDTPDAWLMYNGINRALTNSVKSIVQRNAADEMVFNAITEEVFV